jgi:hypothetical protein
MTEIQVILHTVNGDVTTTYGTDNLGQALLLIQQ